MSVWTGKTILVTGDRGFLGAAITSRLLDCGAEVIGIDNRLFSGTPRVGHWPFYGDVTDIDQLKTIADTARRLDGIVCAHGLDAPPNTSDDDPWRLWDEMLSVNLTGTAKVCQVFGDPMEHGSIVLIASMYGVIAPDPMLYPWGFIKPFAYAASKAGVIGLARSLAAHYSTIRVNALAPGGVENGQPMEFQERYAERTSAFRMATAKDVVNAALFLLSEEASYITGQTLLVDGGFSIV